MMSSRSTLVKKVVAVGLRSREKAILFSKPQDNIGALAQPIVSDVCLGTSIGLAGKQLTFSSGQHPHLVTKTVWFPSDKLFQRVGPEMILKTQFYVQS